MILSKEIVKSRIGTKIGKCMSNIVLYIDDINIAKIIINDLCLSINYSKSAVINFWKKIQKKFGWYY